MGRRTGEKVIGFVERAGSAGNAHQFREFAAGRQLERERGIGQCTALFVTGMYPVPEAGAETLVKGRKEAAIRGMFEQAGNKPCKTDDRVEYSTRFLLGRLPSRRSTRSRRRSSALPSAG